MISFNQVAVFFGGFELFSDVSFLVSSRERVGLVGKNGAGKTTILRIITGEMSASSGDVSVPSELSVGYLPQQMEVVNGRTVMQEAMLAFAEILDLGKDVERISNELSQNTDYNSTEYNNLINQLTEKSERFALMGGESIDATAEVTLQGLGFKRSDFDRPTSEFSGGWRMRIELAKILLRKPDVLLLDEPTNHLDIESIQWLEDYLKNFPGALMLISHDRAFLDNVTSRTIELSMGKAYDYRVPYTKFVELRKERQEQQLATYKNQQKQIGETKDFIERFRYKATKASQVQSRIKHLEKLDIIDIDEFDASSINIRFPEAPRSGTVVVEAKDVGKKFGDHRVFSDANFNIVRGEKVAFVGRNGEGKTTMSRLITGELEYEGELKTGHNVSIGYFAQNQDELMNPKLTVFETIDKVAVGDIRTKIRDILGSFLFSGEDIDKKVSVLSGGERNRLALAKLMLQPYNLLVLDEPTNHLDMRSQDILKNALKQFKGTVIIVSHDRDFLNELVTKTYEFRDAKVKEHLGGIYEFLKKRRLENLKELEVKKEAEKKEKTLNSESDEKKKWLDRKEQEKALRKVMSQLEKVEAQITELEEKIAEMDVVLNNPENNADVVNEDFYKKYQAIKSQVEKAMHHWEELSEQKSLMSD